VTKAKLIKDTLKTLEALGLPRAQQNERSALCLLALLNLPPGSEWSEAADPLIGVTPMMDWIREQYKKKYAPNTRETVRRQTMHQFVAAGIAILNPDKPERPVNSPGTVYQVEPTVLRLLRLIGTPAWKTELNNYREGHPTLIAQYAKARDVIRIPVVLQDGSTLTLSPGAHSELIRDIIGKFAPLFVHEGVLIYAGDTGEKWGYFDKELLNSIGVTIESHGKMPDVVILDRLRNWLILVESVTSHGPVDGKRHAELATLFASSTAGIVYVTAFPTRSQMTKYLSAIAWETEVWVAESPTHLIHFNGDRFLGPHPFL
jgi:hypothetical protein